MASKKHSGSTATPYPATAGTPKGGIPHPSPEGVPADPLAGLMPDGAREYAAALTAVAGHLRDRGAAGLGSAVKRLDKLAHELLSDADYAGGCLPEAPSDDEAPAEWAVDEERRLLILEAAWQTDALMEKILGELPNDTDTVALLSMAVRVRDLAGATMSLADDGVDSIGRLHRRVCGIRRHEGAAS